MKNNLFIILALAAIVMSCGKPGKKNDKSASGNESGVVKEYYSNGKVKTEISAVGQLREGLTKNYDREGRLLSQVNYVKNVMDGTATNFYAKTGKINSTLVYKNGIKEGDETWYYESGKPYRISPYIKGKIEGTQKLYYENGQLMAEVPYKNGFAGAGLKEYNQDGSLVKDYPTIVIQREDHLKNANKVLLIISLSNKDYKVKFYKGSLQKGNFLHDQLLTLATQEGSTQMDFNVPPGAMLKQDISITANYKTPKGNPYIITKHYLLNVSN